METGSGPAPPAEVWEGRSNETLDSTFGNSANAVGSALGLPHPDSEATHWSEDAPLPIPGLSPSPSLRSEPSPSLAAALRSSSVDASRPIVPGPRTRSTPAIAVEFHSGMLDSNSRSNVPNLYTQVQYHAQNQGGNMHLQNSQALSPVPPQAQQGPPPPMIWRPDNQVPISNAVPSNPAQTPLQSQVLAHTIAANHNGTTVASVGSVYTSTPPQPVPFGTMPGPGQPGYAGYGPSSLPSIQQWQVQNQFPTLVHPQMQGPVYAAQQMSMQQPLQQVPMQQLQFAQPYIYQQPAQYVPQRSQSNMPPYSAPPPGGIVPAPYNKGNQPPQQQRSNSGKPPYSAPRPGGIIPMSYKASQRSKMPPHSKPPPGGIIPASYSATQAQLAVSRPPSSSSQQGLPIQQPQQSPSPQLQQIPAAGMGPGSAPAQYMTAQVQQLQYTQVQYQPQQIQQVQQPSQVVTSPQPGSQLGGYVSVPYVTQQSPQQHPQEQTSSGSFDSSPVPLVNSSSVVHSTAPAQYMQPAVTSRPPSQPQPQTIQPHVQAQLHAPATMTPPPGLTSVATGYTSVPSNTQGMSGSIPSPAQSPQPQYPSHPTASQASQYVHPQPSQTIPVAGLNQPVSGCVPALSHAPQATPAIIAQQSANASIAYSPTSSVSAESSRVSYNSMGPGQLASFQVMPQTVTAPIQAHPASTPPPRLQSQSPASSLNLQPVSTPASPLPRMQPQGAQAAAQTQTQTQIQVQYAGPGVGQDGSTSYTAMAAAGVAVTPAVPQAANGAVHPSNQQQQYQTQQPYTVSQSNDVPQATHYIDDATPFHVPTLPTMSTLAPAPAPASSQPVQVVSSSVPYNTSVVPNRAAQAAQIPQQIPQQTVSPQHTPQPSQTTQPQRITRRAPGQTRRKLSMLSDIINVASFGTLFS